MNTKLTSLLAFLSVASVFAVPTHNPANGHYYDIVDIARENPGISWTDAKTAAEATSHLGQAGHLATVTSQAEMDFLIQTFPQIIASLSIGGHILGGYQADTSGGPADGWAWVTGEAWNYTNWSPGEPNDFQGTPENYLAIHDYLGSNPNGLWNDIGNFSNTGYLIEYSSVPEAGSTLLLLGIALAGLAIRKRR